MKKIGITVGDPKGIGPEVISKALRKFSKEDIHHIRTYGDLSVPNTVTDYDAAKTAIDSIDAALEDALAGNISAIVTAPVNKKRIQLIRPNFAGHTEYLAEKSGVKNAVMMFYFKSLLVSLVTRHCPLGKVTQLIDSHCISTTIKQTDRVLKRYFGMLNARIAVLSLNPHAGENGIFGFEEKEFIEPAVKKAAGEGINCVGPLSADSLFMGEGYKNFDGIVAMYHDQGLIPAKLLGKYACVNITAGLPFIRTAPGHGTAEDIAGKGIADETGMVEAIGLAMKMIH